MGLKTVVKMNAVNNLTDARYCAGMGVEMAGFVVRPENPRYIEAGKLREITGWLAGIQLIAEIPGSSSVAEIEKVLADYSVTGIQIDGETPSGLTFDGTIINRVPYSPGKTSLSSYSGKNSNCYVLLVNSEITNALDYRDELKQLCQETKVLLGFGFDHQNIESIFSQITPAGIALEGGDEDRPGFRDLSEISDLLELLEVED